MTGTRYLMLVVRTEDNVDFVVMVDRSLTMWIVSDEILLSNSANNWAGANGFRRRCVPFKDAL